MGVCPAAQPRTCSFFVETAEGAADTHEVEKSRSNSGSPRSCAIGSNSKGFTSSRVGVLFSTFNQCLFPQRPKTATTTKPTATTCAFNLGGTPPTRP